MEKSLSEGLFKSSNLKLILIIFFSTSEILCKEATASFVMDHGRFGPPGVLGGTDGGKNKVKIKRKNKKDYVPEHLSKEQDIRLKKGDKVQVQTPGGGGFGNPKKRKKHLIINDILEEKLSPKDALKIYGKKII